MSLYADMGVPPAGHCESVRHMYMFVELTPELPNVYPPHVVTMKESVWADMSTVKTASTLGVPINATHGLYVTSEDFCCGVGPINVRILPAYCPGAVARGIARSLSDCVHAGPPHPHAHCIDHVNATEAADADDATNERVRAVATVSRKA